MTTEKQNYELALWNQWREDSDPKKLNELVTSFQPVVNRTVRTYSTAAIPRSALEAQAKNFLVSGLKTYDPSRGTQLNTHLINYQKGIYRFVNSHKNIVRIPEHRARKVGLFMNVFDKLEEENAREPTAVELAEELNWDIREVERMSKELVKDLIGHHEESIFNEFKRFDDCGENKEILEFIYYDLTPEEKLVYEYTYGWFGKPELITPNKIASATKMTPEKVRRIKRNISKKMKVALSHN